MQLKILKPVIIHRAKIPLFSARVPAGFPSPCDPHIQKRLNIHEYLVDQEDATFMVTVCSLSLRDAGILPNDFAVVNRAAEAKVGNIVLAVVNGEFTLKILGVDKRGNPILEPANPDFKPIVIQEGMDFEIWGGCDRHLSALSCAMTTFALLDVNNFYCSVEASRQGLSGNAQ